MPQLVKGGKWAYGWTRVSKEGAMRLPPEAAVEYNLTEDGPLILVAGSRTSGGLGLSRPERLQGSPLAAALAAGPESPEQPGGRADRGYLQGNVATISLETLRAYGVSAGDRLLVIRGSGLALGLAIRGPIVEEARKHPELKEYRVETENHGT